jgi:hypothetical protein
MRRQGVRDPLRSADATRSEDEAYVALVAPRSDAGGRSLVASPRPYDRPIHRHLVRRGGARLEALYDDERVVVPLDVEAARAVADDLAGFGGFDPDRRGLGPDIAQERTDEDVRVGGRSARAPLVADVARKGNVEPA